MDISPEDTLEYVLDVYDSDSSLSDDNDHIQADNKLEKKTEEGNVQKMKTKSNVHLVFLCCKIWYIFCFLSIFLKENYMEKKISSKSLNLNYFIFFLMTN